MNPTKITVVLEKRMKQSKHLVLCLLLGVIYFLSAKLGLSFAFEQANSSPIWPATGLALAALLYFGYRIWPAILFGSFALNYSADTALLPSILIALGNLFEALTGYFLVLKFVGRYPFDTVKSTLRFVAVVFVATMISATIGVGALLGFDATGQQNLLLLWTTWWLGNVVGALVITPLLLTLAIKPRIEFTLMRLYESMAILSCAVLTAWVVFNNWTDMTASHSLSFLLIPTIVWAALRFYQHGATGIILLYTSIAIYSTLNGYGPFVATSANESLLFLQTFMAIIVITALALSASVDETKRVETQLNEARANLEKQVKTRTSQLSCANEELLTQVGHRQQSSESMQRLLDASSLPSDEQYFHAITKELTQIYNCHYSFIGVFDNNTMKNIRTLSLRVGNQHQDNFSYALANTPCHDVLNNKMQLIPCNAPALYPNDDLLIQMGIESYFGAPILSPTNQTLGIVAVMDTKPMILGEWVRPVLGLLANRVSFELEREKSAHEIQLAASVFKETVEAIMICDNQKRILRVNPAFCHMTGFSAQEVIGKTPQELESKKQGEAYYQAFWCSIDKSGTWQGEIWHKRKNDKAFPCWQTIKAVTGNQQKIKQYITVFSDITNKKQAEEKIYRLAHYDVLTGLPNRSLFIDQLDRALENARLCNQTLGLLFMDLDHFKLVNDSAGHSTGDELLVKVADRLRKFVTKKVVISRFGGDEFTVLMRDIDSSQAIQSLGQAILNELTPPFTLDNKEVMISASIGYCCYPTDAQNAHELLKNADIAMYKAKEDGRQNIKQFTPKMHLKAKQRVEVEHQLRIALKQNQFVLHYQPQVEFDSGKVVGCEALVRWLHPEKGMIPPNDFIPIAEESGLIVPLGDWVLEQACRQFILWQQQGVKLNRMAVNLSPRQFANHDLEGVIKQVLSDTGMKPENLELELTESMLMENVELTIETMNRLKLLGIQLSIDDFGTGYSSMAYLKHFPIDKLKIDKSFIDDLLVAPQDAAIVNATINLAHGLGLVVIAEGVETEEQVGYLQAHQCEEIQGYYFCRPYPADSPILLDVFEMETVVG
jgi:diguanylate cyclase (GGDEF)-like protein/PAS domain S-box-containing protein